LTLYGFLKLAARATTITRIAMMIDTVAETPFSAKTAKRRMITNRRQGSPNARPLKRSGLPGILRVQ
jgi:hypothetical protein